MLTRRQAFPNRAVGVIRGDDSEADDATEAPVQARTGHALRLEGNSGSGGVPEETGCGRSLAG